MEREEAHEIALAVMRHHEENENTFKVSIGMTGNQASRPYYRLHYQLKPGMSQEVIVWCSLSIAPKDASKYRMVIQNAGFPISWDCDQIALFASMLVKISNLMRQINALLV